jgi:hypothetical protein
LTGHYVAAETLAGRLTSGTSLVGDQGKSRRGADLAETEDLPANVHGKNG